MNFIIETQSIQLWRYEDPILGDCKIPVFNEPTKDKVLINPDSIFKVDVEKSIVNIVNGNEVCNIGQNITYLVV